MTEVEARTETVEGVLLGIEEIADLEDIEPYLGIIVREKMSLLHRARTFCKGVSEEEMG